MSIQKHILADHHNKVEEKIKSGKEIKEEADKKIKELLQKKSKKK